MRIKFSHRAYMNMFWFKTVVHFILFCQICFCTLIYFTFLSWSWTGDIWHWRPCNLIARFDQRARQRYNTRIHKLRNTQYNPNTSHKHTKCNLIWYNIIKHNPKQSNTIHKHSISKCNPIWYNGIQCNQIQHNTVHKHSVAQIQYFTRTQYNPVLLYYFTQIQCNPLQLDTIW